MVECQYADEYECGECPLLGSTQCHLLRDITAEVGIGHFLGSPESEGEQTTEAVRPEQGDRGELRQAERDVRTQFLNRVADAAIAVLLKHGVPAHWALISEMVRREPEMQSIADRVVYSVLASRKDLFQATTPGVYDIAPDRPYGAGA